mmetsp:Transcript_19800/g.58717  ORF Transcript_19800/g.58717 Transcript_19800/m.58717 type:complete len:360 (-) Transcript_19800:193-1272(-)
MSRVVGGLRFVAAVAVRVRPPARDEPPEVRLELGKDHRREALEELGQRLLVHGLAVRLGRVGREGVDQLGHVVAPEHRQLGVPLDVFLFAKHGPKRLHGEDVVAHHLHAARRLAQGPDRLEAQPGEARPARALEEVDEDLERQDDGLVARLEERGEVHDVVEQVLQPRFERRVRVEVREQRLDGRRAGFQYHPRGELLVPDRVERREARLEVRHPGGRGFADDVPGLERDRVVEVGAAPRLEGLLVEGLSRVDRGRELVLGFLGLDLTEERADREREDEESAGIADLNALARDVRRDNDREGEQPEQHVREHGHGAARLLRHRLVAQRERHVGRDNDHAERTSERRVRREEKDGAAAVA